MKPRGLGFFVLALLLGLGQSSASAGFDYREIRDGDLSNDRLNPTRLIANLGANSVMGGTITLGGVTDRDYFVVNIPVGLQLDDIILADYFGDNRSFMAIQFGSTFTEPPVGTDVTRLHGWFHITDVEIGFDVLPIMASGAGAIGYNPPLPAGDYVFWVQETSSIAAAYTLVFNTSSTGGGGGPDPVVPEPASLTMASLAIMTGALYTGLRRRRVSPQ